MTGTLGQRVLRTLLCFFAAGLCASCAPKASLDIQSGEWFVARLASRSYKVDAVQWMLQDSYPDFVSLLSETPAKRVAADMVPASREYFSRLAVETPGSVYGEGYDHADMMVDYYEEIYEELK